MTRATERTAGRIPPNSSLRHNGAVGLTLYGHPGSNYLIQTTSDLLGVGQTSWASNLTVTLPERALELSVPLGASNRFFRVLEQ